MHGSAPRPSTSCSQLSPSSGCASAGKGVWLDTDGLSVFVNCVGVGVGLVRMPSFWQVSDSHSPMSVRHKTHTTRTGTHRRSARSSWCRLRLRRSSARGARHPRCIAPGALPQLAGWRRLCLARASVAPVTAGPHIVAGRLCRGEIEGFALTIADPPGAVSCPLRPAASSAVGSSYACTAPSVPPCWRPDVRSAIARRSLH